MYLFNCDKWLQHRTDTYKSRVTDQGVHLAPLRNALTFPSSASARLDLREVISLSVSSEFIVGASEGA